jgi:hypothetical protein
LREAWNRPSFTALRRNKVADTLVSNFQPANCETIKKKKKASKQKTSKGTKLTPS